MKRNIHLYGSLSEQVGVKEITLDVNTPTELVSGLNSQVKGFKDYMRGKPEMAILFADDNHEVVESLTTSNFNFPIGTRAKNIHLVPPTEGAGVELAAMFVAMGASSAVAATLASITINLAVAYAVGRISAILSPTPDTSQGNPVDAKASFLFNGAINVVEQGYAIPCIYGVHTVGSIVVSAGTDVGELAYGTVSTYTGSSPPVQSPQWGQ